jgi:hypothetical protein
MLPPGRKRLAAAGMTCGEPGVANRRGRVDGPNVTFSSVPPNSSAPPHTDPMSVSAAHVLLRAHGADAIPHPGGTLLAHLDRVHATLVAWHLPPDVCLAGLCHAAYGTDGFATALLDLADRAVLAAAIGPAAERLVHFYGSCDRDRTYPLLAGPAPVAWRDRWTGETTFPSDAELRAFLSITVANELDVIDHNPVLAERAGPWLLRMVTVWVPLIGPTEWADCRTRLARFAEIA